MKNYRINKASTIFKFNEIQFFLIALRSFEEYQKATINLVQTIPDVVSKSQNIETLNAVGVMTLLQFLL